MSEFQLILDILSQEYGLPQLSFLREPQKGISTKNLIAEDRNGRIFFIKKYKKSDLLKIENSERSADFVKENSNIPVVLPVKNKREELHTNIDGESYSIFPYISHADYRPPEDDRIAFTHQLGEMLGKIHSVSRSTPVPESVKRISAWASNNKEESIAELEKVRELINKKVSKDEYDKKALDFIELKISLLRERQFTEQDKELTVCHGDYHSANLLFNEEGIIIGVCDWDISGLENPYNEFIRSLNMCVVRRDFDRLGEKKDVTKAFLEGYTGNCGFTFEIEELEYALETWYEKVLTSVWPLSDHYNFQHFKTDPSLDSEFDKIIFLRDRRKELLELVSKSL